ncbi:hypothetical protein EDB55_0418 [Vibrio crassostreae]|uniref:hypothetical protein n=1 Tax=Vibrio crassostreae TaxID=246167 RepID=UPI000F46BC1C|nr:hypothetical protein [Vibrio crassostreae]ROR85747.1 hypothetical protein EDB55_0418 [Vibrio crassostreae]
MIFLDTFTKDSFRAIVVSFSNKLKDCCDKAFPASYKQKIKGADDGSEDCIAILNKVSRMQLEDIKAFLKEAEALLKMEARGANKEQYLPVLDKLIPSEGKIRQNDRYNRMHNVRLFLSLLALKKLVKLNPMVGSHPKSANAAERLSTTAMNQFIPPLASDFWIGATLNRFDKLTQHIQEASFKEWYPKHIEIDKLSTDKLNQSFKRLADIIVANGITGPNDITVDVLLSYHNDLMAHYDSTPAAYNIKPAIDLLVRAGFMKESHIYDDFINLRVKISEGIKAVPNNVIHGATSSKLEDLVGTGVQGIKEIEVPVKDRKTSLDYGYWSGKAGSDSMFFPDKLDVNNIWIATQLDYIRATSNEAATIKQKKMRLSILNKYLFSYLPVYFEAGLSGKFTYPNQPEDLLHSLYVQRSNVFEIEFHDKFTDGFQYPVSLQQFVYDMTSAVHREDTQGNNSGRDALLIINNFFDYLAGIDSGLVHNFKNPLTGKAKEKKGRRYVKNTKYVFGLEYWLGLRSFCSAVTNQMLEESKASIKSGQDCKNHIIVDADVNIDGSFPMKIGRVSLEHIPKIKLIKHDDIRLKKGPKDENVYIHNHIAWSLMTLGLHSGLRRANAIWLDDRECFNLCTNSDSAFQSLIVTTDKAREHSYPVIVSTETMEMLKKVREVKKMAIESNPVIGEAIPYDGNEDSKWGTISPLFRLKKTHNDNACPNLFSEIINEYEAFLRQHGVDFEPTTVFTPRLHYSLNEFIHLNSLGGFDTKLCDILVSYHDCYDGVPFTPVIRKTRITPHSLRTMTASVYTPILGADVVGKYLTGQSESMVDFYTKSLPDSSSKELISQVLTLKDMDATGPKTLISLRELEINQKKFEEELQKSPNRTLDKYNAQSINIDVGEGNIQLNGLRELRKGHFNNISYFRTHICPIEGKCPKEVIDTIGEKKCFACPLTVTTNNNLPALTATIKSRCDEITTINTKLDNFEMLEEEKKALKADKMELILEASYWEVRKQIIEDSNKDGIYYVSDEGLQLMSSFKAECATEQELLMLRLKETEGVPQLHSEKLKMQASRLRRKIEIRAKDRAGHLSDDVSDIEFLAMVVKTKADLQGLTDEQTVALVSTTQ